VVAASGKASGRAVPVPRIVNQTKMAIVAVMLELDRPVSSVELQMIWAELKELSIFEYHLSTLVRARVAEIVVGGPELRFRLSGHGHGRGTQQQATSESGSGAAEY